MNQQLQSCFDDVVLFDYLAGRLAAESYAQVESHIAACDKCFETLATFDPIMLAEESEHEVSLIHNIYERTLTNAETIFPDSSREISTTISTVSWPEARLSIWSRLQSRKLFQLPSIAAAVFALFLASAVIWLIISLLPQTDPELTRGLVALKDATDEIRPSEFRITGLDYAPYPQERSGLATIDKDRLAGARAALSAAVAKQPTPETLQALGKVLLAIGEFDQAIDRFTQASTMAPSNAEIISDLAVAHAEKGDWSGAIDDLNRALTIDPTNITVIFNRALLYQRMKQYDKARADWQRYLQLDPSSPWTAEVHSRWAKIKNSE
ncbi:MAG: tetratricopeptide repeat protein [Acidobacteriota bacterium]